MAEKKSTAKKSAAKKSAAKKTETKEVEKPKAESSEEEKSSAPRKSKAERKLEKVAEETLKGVWGSGRDRDIRLREAGHDPSEVQRVRARLRASS